MKYHAFISLVNALLVVVLAVVSTPAYALVVPKPFSTDHRIQTVIYSPNQVFRFTGHYGYQSVIEFEEGESVETISLGDSVSWQVAPGGSRIFIKPVEQDALTNMTVVTSRRTYHFELHAKDTENVDDPDMVFVMRFVYGRGSGVAVSHMLDGVPDPTIEPEKYNFDYSLRGPEDIAPIRIFDDGEFTYFQFRDRNAEVPAFFLVHGDGSESIINFRTRGDYIVVERVAARFTLRHGEDTICVYNNTRNLSDSGSHPRPLNGDDPNPNAAGPEK